MTQNYNQRLEPGLSYPFMHYYYNFHELCQDRGFHQEWYRQYNQGAFFDIFILY